jgi:hypothetical protein
MKLFILTICMLALCSYAIIESYSLERWAEMQEVRPANYLHILTKADSITVMDYHGILFMEWSVAHRDFIFKRDGVICRTRAFEILKERK